MRQLLRRALAVVAGLGTVLSLGLATTSASAYQPTAATLFQAQDTGSCNKYPCVLYPKSAQLPSGRVVMTFEDSEGDPVGQTLPVYASDDYGTTWQKVSEVASPAELTAGTPRAAEFAKFTSNWTNPFFYVLPQDVGGLTKGTLLLASVVSGDDPYYRAQKAANPSWTPTGDGARQDVSIVLFASTDEGVTWSVVSTIAQGGSQSTLDGNGQRDPVWEPYLMVHDGLLVVYYSDERDPGTGENNGQTLVHTTTSDGVTWSDKVYDVGEAYASARPGMTTIVPTTDGRWLMTFEYWASGQSAVQHKIVDDPLDLGSASFSAFPGGAGGSPVLLGLPDGRIVYNDNSGGNRVLVNESGSSTGAWKTYQTTLPNGYSRQLQYVQGTGRVLVFQAPWGYGPIRYAEVDLGYSEAPYYTLVNRLTGQVLGTGGKTQDANLTGNTPDVVLEAGVASAATQRWHLTAKGGNVTLLNKAGGRAAGIWTGSATAGQKLAQWVDDGGTDKEWTLVATGDGYYKLRSVRNTSLYMTGATAGGAVVVQPAIDATGTAAADDSQEWQLVQEVNRLQSFNFQTRYVRHVNFDARIDANVSPAADAQWHIVEGLVGGTGFVSFESVNFPGYYLRQSGFDFVLAPYDGTEGFRADASFKKVPGLASSSWSSFQSYRYPDRYIRHYGYQLRLDPITTATGRSDATFRVTG